jgi:hypothetical protein
LGEGNQERMINDYGLPNEVDFPIAISPAGKIVVASPTGYDILLVWISLAFGENAGSHKFLDGRRLLQSNSIAFVGYTLVGQAEKRGEDSYFRGTANGYACRVLQKMH